MMRQSFGRALGFAALAAALTIPVMILGSAVWGYDASLVLYLLALVPLRTFSAASDLRSGVRAGLATGLLSLLLMAAIDSVQAALLAVLVELALGRALLATSAPRSIGRVLFMELVLGALSFGVFSMLRDQHLVGDAIAVWGLYLVQSVFAVISQPSRAREDEPRDRFVAAQAAVERLLQP